MEEFSQYKAKFDNLAYWFRCLTLNQMGSPLHVEILQLLIFLNLGIVASNLHQA